MRSMSSSGVIFLCLAGHQKHLIVQNAREFCLYLSVEPGIVLPSLRLQLRAARVASRLPAGSMPSISHTIPITLAMVWFSEMQPHLVHRFVGQDQLDCDEGPQICDEANLSRTVAGVMYNTLR